MSDRNEDILYRDLEIPEIVWEKAETAFLQIYMEEERGKHHAKKGKMRKIHFLPKVAVAAMICCLIFGTTVAAMEILS